MKEQKEIFDLARYYFLKENFKNLFSVLNKIFSEKITELLSLFHWLENWPLALKTIYIGLSNHQNAVVEKKKQRKLIKIYLWLFIMITSPLAAKEAKYTSFLLIILSTLLHPCRTLFNLLGLLGVKKTSKLQLEV
jgi:hypothetical protein